MVTTRDSTPVKKNANNPVPATRQHTSTHQPKPQVRPPQLVCSPLYLQSTTPDIAHIRWQATATGPTGTHPGYHNAVTVSNHTAMGHKLATHATCRSISAAAEPNGGQLGWPTRTPGYTSHILLSRCVQLTAAVHAAMHTQCFITHMYPPCSLVHTEHTAHATDCPCFLLPRYYL